MMALGLADESSPAHDEVLPEVRLSDILAAAAEREPQRLAIADEPGREAWSGRPRIAWTCASSHHVVERLAAFLSMLDLRPGTSVAISLPNGSEACIALLAVERAGLVPCLFPAGWDEEGTGRALAAVGAEAVICQGFVAEERPAEAFCRLSARSPRLRVVCAFGPLVPEGAIDLDRAILDTPMAAVPPLPDAPGGVVTFEERGGDPVPLFRPFRSVLTAAAAFLATQAILPDERLCTLLAPDDHASLTTGLVASLLAGVTLECVGLPDGAAIRRALDPPGPTHLVAPAFLEAALAQAGLPDPRIRTVLVHRPPLRFGGKGELGGRVTDVLAFGERACLGRARRADGRIVLSLGEGTLAAPSLLDIRREDDGEIAFAGAAAEVVPFERGAPQGPVPRWRRSGFRADLFAGIAIGVR